MISHIKLLTGLPWKLYDFSIKLSIIMQADKDIKESQIILDGVRIKDCIQRCNSGEEILRVLDVLPTTSHFDGTSKITNNESK